MRIGIVVDSACDLPPEWLEAAGIVLLPVTVRIGDAELVDVRDPQATLGFIQAHGERGHSAETAAFPADRIKSLFLDQLVIDYDYVFCLTVARSRSQIHDNAAHASYAILNEYRQPRSAAGHATPFSLRVIDSQQVFAGQGILPVEAVRLREAEASAPEIRSRLEFLAGRSYTYMVPRDLGYLRARTRHRGDRSVSLLAATLGGALDIKPILHCHQGETGPVGKVRGFEPAAQKLFDCAIERVREGLLTPTLCLSYGGELDVMRALPHYDRLIRTCREHGIEVFETVMSLSGMVNVGPGALTIGFAAPPHAFV
ncbi:DegV family protein [Luteimonas yindakuii]|uniref:DegV family protein n=1 Tax=Luteimonas yindakuii TaxID=2565782 RepID=UPI0010A34FBF|nr:DegV family protein [Luteimonas yindakuii]QCO66821.1 DegV family protein [Luteimonas yindakuii]